MQADLTISMEKNSVQQVPAPTNIEDIPDDLLEFVLLQVPTPACLLRAAATCKLWRRVITGDGFLHRFRSIHGPRLVLGHYAIDKDDNERGNEKIYTDFIPSPPRQAAATHHLYQRFSLDFLPRAFGPYTKLFPTDSRGGLLAVVNGRLWENLVVCNPWTGQYSRVLHIPWTRPVFAPEGGYCEHKFLGAFLLGSAEDDDETTAISMSNFRVVYARIVYDEFSDRVTAQAYVYSARDDRLLVLAPPINPGVRSEHFGWNSQRTLEMFNRFMGRAGGSLFWSGHRGHVLQLDENTVEFSGFALPLASNDNGYMLDQANYHRGNLRVVGGGAGAVHIVRIVDSDLEVFLRVHGDSRECVLHKRIGLWQLAKMKQVRPERRWCFWDTPSSAGGALRLMVSSSASVFCIDVETMELERIDETTYLHTAELLFPYELPWPRNINSDAFFFDKQH